MRAWVGTEGGRERLIVLTGDHAGRHRYVSARLGSRRFRSLHRSGWWLRLVCRVFGHQALGLLACGRYDRDEMVCPCGRSMSGARFVVERHRRP